jgi:plastocyanin
MLLQLRTIWPALLLLAAASHVFAADHRVTVGGTSDGGYYGGGTAILSFTPSTVTVQTGDTVTFVNAGGATHNVHADDDSFRCAAGCDGVAGGNGTPNASGWTSTITITQAAGTEIPFHCDVHQSMGMVGVIKVAAPAGGTTNAAITSAFSGAWYDPNQSGHGILVEVLPNNQFLAFWFTFNPDGTQQSWFGNVGSIDPATNTASVAALQTQGGEWIPNFDPDNVTHPAWGTLTFSFSDCNHGRADFTSVMPGYGTGHMDLTRLTQPAGLSCP